jgi:radical SAM superfamily enzyme YgiQ (UPF0313 family)
MTTEEARQAVLLVNPASTTNGTTLTELIHYAHLGLLTLGTSLRRRLEEKRTPARVLYFDGALHGNDYIHDFIARSGRDIAVLGLSAHCHNYAACVELARQARAANPNVVTIIGNDHFSALYDRIMRKRVGTFDYGFHGNDVVEGFAAFVTDLLRGRLDHLSRYPGLVYRDAMGVHRNPEDPDEFERLPLVDYSLVDSLIPHSRKYHRAQVDTYRYMRDENLNAAAIDIARGCIKFAGPRTAREVPQNACDFCGIIPGRKAITAVGAERAWERIHGAVQQGFNYLLVTADSLPSTFWPLLRAMAEHRPDWYEEMAPAERPRLMCYSRADSFEEPFRHRIDVLMRDLGCDHFFIGLESFSTDSLKAMAKGIDEKERELLTTNMVACHTAAQRGARITAGIILNHFGITPALMEVNFTRFNDLVREYQGLFVELDFEPYMPIPGSLSFDYMSDPALARSRAAKLGVGINEAYLTRIADRYRTADVFERDELVEDFILGCCPGVTPRMVDDYLSESRSIVEAWGIVGG